MDFGKDGAFECSRISRRDRPGNYTAYIFSYTNIFGMYVQCVFRSNTSNFQALTRKSGGAIINKVLGKIIENKKVRIFLCAVFRRMKRFSILIKHTEYTYIFKPRGHFVK